MDPVAALLLLLAGCVAGFLAGVFGRGGEVILVPLLLYIYRTSGVSSLVATHMALGTSLLIVACASAASSVAFYRNRHVIVRAVAIAGLAGAVGALGGTLLAGGMQGRELQKVFAAVLLAAAARLLVPQRKYKTEAEPDVPLPTLVLGGLVVGMVTSLGGVAGGVAAVPLFYAILKFPLLRASGTSSATVFIAACAGVAGYIYTGWGNEFLPGGTLGFVDWMRAIPVAIGMIPASFLGASVATRFRTRTAGTIYGVLLLVIATRMFFL